MSDVSAPVAPAATPTAPEAAPNPNMTGEEARAWVEAQKAKEAKPVVPGKSVSAKTESTSGMLKEAAAEAKRKLKIDDEEVDEEEVIKTYKDRKGHQQAANKKLQEGLAARKQAEEYISMMRDPDKFFEVAKKLGQDPRKLSEMWIARELEDELLDPREKEFRATKKELDAIKAEKKAEQEKIESERNRILKDKYTKDYEEQFVGALQEFKLPPTKQTVADMAKYVYDAAQIGFQMTAAEAAQLVKEDIQAKTQRLFAEADGDVLINLLGEQVANKVRKWDTSRLKNPESGLRTPQEQADPSTIRQRSAPKRAMTPREWREFNRK